MSIRFNINGFINSNDDIKINDDYLILPSGKEIKIMPVFMNEQKYTNHFDNLEIRYDINIEESEYYGEGWDN